MLYLPISKTRILLLVLLIATYAKAECKFYYWSWGLFDFIKCHNTTVENLSDEIFSLYNNTDLFIRKIDLELINIDLISLDALNSTLKENIRHLNVYNNSANVNLNTFSSLIYCSSIKLYGGTIEDFSGLNHSSLTSLTVVNFNIKSITSICENSPNLNELNLSGNKLKKITKFTFANCTNLQNLDLSNNRIKNIEEDGFYGLDNLLDLNLKGNKLSSITPSIFNKTKNLFTLDIQRNKIKEIYRFSFFELSHLQELCLDYNNISTLRNNTFAGLSDLEYLNITNSQIITLEPGVFNGLDWLHSIDISVNPINDVLQGAFMGLSLNSYLYMSNTNMTILKENQFLGLDSIWSINVTSSNIKTIETGALNSMPYLQELDLSSNLLLTIPCDLSDSDLQHMEYLDLSNNMITNIKNCTFQVFPSLKTILLKNNNIKYLHSSIFSNLKELVDLHIENNQLKYLDDKLISTLGKSPKFNRIELSGNPWDCQRLNETLEQFKEMNINISTWIENGSTDHFDGIACITYIDDKAVTEESSTVGSIDREEDFDNVTVNQNITNIDNFEGHSVKNQLILAVVVIIGILVLFVIIVFML